MKLDRIEISGYKRLASASTYVGRKTLALVGPNEAGKSSVLETIGLFNSDLPVPVTARSRSVAAPATETEEIAVLSFALSKDEIETLADLELETLPRFFRLHKSFGGALTHSYLPEPVVNKSVFERVKKAWPQLEKAILAEIEIARDSDEESAIALSTSFETVRAQIGGGTNAKRADWLAVAAPLEISEGKQRTKVLTSAIEDLTKFNYYYATSVRIADRVHRAVQPRVPSFLSFDKGQRELRHDYNLDDPEEVSHPALDNLLRVAGTDIQKIQESRADSSRKQTLLARANVKLQEFFRSAWKQAELTVEIDLEGPTLYIYVKDLKGDPSTVRITDRSDGLRLFVCLATFLSGRDTTNAPILLIDEAELHLHLNAQADLIGVLQSTDQVSQVVYTTHSPGCLPSDLGTGIRFVQPQADGTETSIIRHDFWSLQTDQGETSVGLSPLLLVMGAGAAAFASLRRAVVAEGASDMLLLPVMVRIATEEAEIPYQVAPGISVASKETFAQLRGTAVHVAYVVDGDAAGEIWREQLIEAGVEKKSILSFGASVALEDLFSREFYLEAFNDFISLTGKAVKASELGAGPIKSALESWCLDRKVKMPGSIALAEHILGKHESHEREIRLSAAGISKLRAFDAKARSLLEVEAVAPPTVALV